MGDVITQEEADAFLAEEIDKEYAPGVERLVKVELNDDEFGSLVSFVYNLGTASLKRSTLLRLLNQDKRLEASNQFLRWSRANGQILRGLIRRRDAERRLFLSED